MKIVFHVPLGGNDGKPFGNGVLAKFRSELIKVAPGYTFYLVRGAWKNKKGRIFKDMQHRFEIAGIKPRRIVRLLREWAAKLGQESVYVEVHEPGPVPFLLKAETKGNHGKPRDEKAA